MLVRFLVERFGYVGWGFSKYFTFYEYLEHRANSFIHILIFYAKRQRRIGSFATKNCSWITHLNPHYIYILLCVRLLFFN